MARKPRTMTLPERTIAPALANYTGDRDAVLDAMEPAASGRQKITLVNCPEDFLRHLLEQDKLATGQRLSLLIYLGERDEEVDWDEMVTSPAEIHNFVLRLGTSSLNAEAMVGGRWYPVTLTTDLHNLGPGNGSLCSVSWAAQLAGQTMKGGGYWATYFFNESRTGGATARDLLEKEDIRELDSDRLEAHSRRVYAALRVSQRTGSVWTAKGTVQTLATVSSLFGGHNREVWRTIALNDAANRVVVDAELESGKEEDQHWYHRSDEATATEWPFVRCFSLAMKRWLYVDIRDIKPYKFDAGVAERLVLPDDMRGIMLKLFEAETAKLAGDVVGEKHGGMIILANGPTGTGKTLTAEVCAEYTRRPLYVMEMAELGTDVNQAEERLERIFARVTRWNAVLLLDECDIFLQERKADLEHNVLVGIFLRLMDYYHGLLFLTTNRGHVIDEAFASRITLRFDYPQLGKSSRRKIWQQLLDLAGVEVVDGLGGVTDKPLNGRQIRNMVRLVKVLYGETVTHENVLRVVGFSASRDDDS